VKVAEVAGHTPHPIAEPEPVAVEGVEVAVRMSVAVAAVHVVVEEGTAVAVVGIYQPAGEAVRTLEPVLQSPGRVDLPLPPRRLDSPGHPQGMAALWGMHPDRRGTLHPEDHREEEVGEWTSLHPQKTRRT
jgi:hypothetical protein